jgi:site-specific DNA-methyltransferase (adenine-specific)
MIEKDKIYCADSLEKIKEFPNDSIDMVITSPPYYQQRDYGNIGIGNEKTPEEYIENLIKIVIECKRVTKDTGSIVFNVGDKYINGNLLLIPYKFALECQKIGLKLINELTWVKVNPTPKQDTRKLVSSKEPFFIFAKSSNFYFDKDSYMDFKDNLFIKKKTNGNDIGKKYFELIDTSTLTKEQKDKAKKELQDTIIEVKAGRLDSFRMKIKGLHALPYGGQAGGRLTQIETKGFTIIKIHGNSIKRDIIESTVENIKGTIHPAIYPEYVVQEIIKLLSKQNDLILDPFIGSGTTAIVAKKLNRNFIGIEIFEEYCKFAEERLSNINQELELFL